MTSMKVTGHTTGSSYYPAVNPPEFHVGSAGGELTIGDVRVGDLADAGYSPDGLDDDALIEIVVQVEAEVYDGEIDGWTIEGAWVPMETTDDHELDATKLPKKLIERIERQAEDEANDA